MVKQRFADGGAVSGLRAKRRGGTGIYGARADVLVTGIGTVLHDDPPVECAWRGAGESAD